MRSITPMRAMCPAENCPLHLYRFGKRPKVGNYTPTSGSAEKRLDSPAVTGAEEGREGE